MNPLHTKNALLRFRSMLRPLVCLFVWSIFSSQLEAAYKYPIGIPKAWIEPDVAQPTRPDPWTSEIAGYYYVDYVAGTDFGRTYGTPVAPRKTIPSPIPAGSRVEVTGAYRPTTGTWFITFDGNGGEWIANTSGPAWLVGNVETRASFSGSITMLGKYGCVDFIDNFGSHKSTGINSGTAGKGRTGNHFLVRNSEFMGTNSLSDTSGGFAISGNSDIGGDGADIVFYNNEVHHFGITEPDGSDPDYIAVFVGNHCHRVWVLDNKLHDMSGSAMQVTANVRDPITTTHIYGGRNECYNLWATGMASKTAGYVVYSENHIYNIKEASSASSSKGIAGQYGATDLWLLFNRIHDCGSGIRRVSGDGRTLYAIGNLIYDIAPRGSIPFNESGWGEGGICLWGSRESYLINNTLYNVPNGIVTPAAPLIFAENNIISNVNEAKGKHFYAQLSGVEKNIRINGNLFHQDGSINIIVPGEPVMNVTSLNASAYGEGNLTGNAQFTDANNKIFTILTSSPARDAGLAPTALENDVYALYYKTFGVSIARDISGSVRPAGAAWDIGAYEFGAAQVRNIPAPDFKNPPVPVK